MKYLGRKGCRRAAAAALSLLLLLSVLAGCSGSGVKLDPANPVTVTVWHYYNGAILNAFDDMVTEFNETIGAEQGIIVTGQGYGNVSDLEKAVLASANKEVGSEAMPDVFASYADTAYEAELKGILADLGQYITDKELAAYRPSYIEEGKIGLNGELRIFPIAKSTETMMLNDTDWQPFAAACDLSYDDLSTLEGLVRVSELYYEWTDAKTPDVPEDGKAFYGRDSMANMFVIGSMELGQELFVVENGEVTLKINPEVMRRLWEGYYVPYINGYFASYGRYRSDDAKVGELLAYIGSTSSASYFPREVTVGERTYPVEAKVLPLPHFDGGERVMVQQGAGMVVTKSTKEKEYASIEFLKWFTDVDNNTLFSAMSGYTPVKTEAADYASMKSRLAGSEAEPKGTMDAVLRIALDDMAESTLYTSKAFRGAAAARSVLEWHLQDKAVADRAAVLAELAAGASRADATAPYTTDAAFDAWLAEFTAALEAATA